VVLFIDDIHVLGELLCGCKLAYDLAPRGPNMHMLCMLCVCAQPHNMHRRDTVLGELLCINSHWDGCALHVALEAGPSWCSS
jgi:folate-dependent tRNA-U54 methylase TrmFO/GidA